MNPRNTAADKPLQTLEFKLHTAYGFLAAILKCPPILSLQFWFTISWMVLTEKGFSFGPLTVLDAFHALVPTPLLF